MARVTLEQVGKTYPGGVVAVQQADLAVNDREFVVLVGPSGCGKSTTLRMIAGLESITHGNIRIGDRVVNEVPPKDRDIAMVFQNYALYPHLTVYENMAFGLRLRRQPHEEIDRRVQEASEILGLGDLLKRRPRELSGGQRQRVAVGRAIVRKPAVFLFDEPLSNLDAKMRVQMRMEIARLHRHLAATMIYVTHDQVEAMTLGDRIVVMKDGVIQQVAAPMELYQRPANTFVAGFIGSPPMNMLRGTLGLSGGRPVLEAEGVRLALDPACVAHLTNAIPGPIVLGLRPESVLPLPSGTPGALPVTIELAEPMGSETHLHLHAGAWSFIARAPASSVVTPGEACAVRLDLKQARFFDTASGRSLD